MSWKLCKVHRMSSACVMLLASTDIQAMHVQVEIMIAAALALAQAQVAMTTLAQATLGQVAILVRLVKDFVMSTSLEIWQYCESLHGCVALSTSSLCKFNAA